jgi:type IV pilus assembly protein PilE
MVSRQVGFTLIELVVAVSIVGILATIAYPTYVNSMAKERRASAKSMMLNIAQLESRFFSENNRYTVSLTALGLPSDPVKSEAGGHSITVAALGAIATGYTITAVPLVSDSQCETLTLTSTNISNATGTDPSQCW